MESDKKVKERPPHPRAKANLFSILTFSWTLGLFFKGFKKDLEVSDLYTTLEDHGSSTLGNSLERHWNREMANANKSNRKPSLLRALVRMFGWRMMIYGIVLAIIEIVMSVIQAVYIGQTVAYFAPDSKMGWTDIYISASGLAICSALKSLFFTMYDMGTAHIGMKARVANCSLIYKKPYCIRQIIGCFNIRGIIVGKEEAYFYAFVLSITAVFTSTLKHWCHVNILQVGMTVRTALCSIIYRKALRLSKTALGETTVGQVVNLLSNDVNRFDIAVIFLHYLWIGPLETVIVTYFLWLEIDAASLIGVAVLLLFIPLQGYLGKKTSSLRLRTAIRTDERVRLMNEIISGIQVIKMYTWELPFTKLVEQAREKEIREIRGTSHIRGILLSFIVFHSRIALFFSIFSYVIVGNSITAQKVFVITSYFNILRQTMTVFFPQGIGQIAEALVSVRRLQTFLLYEENEQYTNMLTMNGVNSSSQKEKRAPIYRKMNSREPPNDEKSTIENSDLLNNHDSNSKEDKYSIVIRNATAKWTPQLADDSLNNINLSVERRGLIAVIGTVGSGKSSLFQAILRELPLKSGDINISGTVSYASQEPWLFAGSVRQNILFGLPMNKEKYREVIKVCALKTDFEQLAYGDKTIVGERGVSLSGGQRARVNLARAVYKEADIYLMDDPLSAVDTHVGKHLFEECISGYLKDKTCILITHQLQYLSSVDHIVLLEQGSIIAEGSYQTLQETGLDFTNLLANQENEEKVADSIKGDEADKINKQLHTRQISIQSVASSHEEGGLQNPTSVEETRSMGNVGFSVYRSYFSFGGNFCFISFMFFTCIVAQLFASGSDAWITYWVNLEEHAYPCMEKFNGTGCQLPSSLPFYVNRETSIYIFAIITFSMIIITGIRSVTFVKMCMNTSMRLHNFMFEGITKASMYFFNTNPSGRILNRFSKDMGSIDEVLPAALVDCVQIGLTLLGIVTVVAFVNFWLLIPTFTIAILFYLLRQFYVSTSRSIKRLEGITRSPVFSHLSASLNGLTTIRAFGAQTILEKEFDNHQDLHSSAWYLFLASSRAFGFWLDMICVVYIALVTFSFLLLGGDTFGGNVGLAITQAIGLTGMFQWGMRQSAELENQMTSVERVLEYGKVTPESSSLPKPVIEPPAGWPSKGELIFRNMFLRYEPNGSHILRNLNFTIKSEEKVGIVGRTGAGKSSLIAALFKLAENEGELIIDGMDINKMGLHEVRSKISIIPQEPVLFSGTMRKNLDPFDEYPDHVLWTALEQVELKEAVQDLAGGLNAKMSEGGTNFSVGQRQLVCLARAIIRNNKILILDEATANVDPQTDALIQITIRQKFQKCTVLTIAHRLNTVMDSDKVLVMDGGTCVEFDHPYILLQNPNGFLHSMVDHVGRSTADHLYNVAAECYRKLMDTRIPHIDEDIVEIPDNKKLI